MSLAIVAVAGPCFWRASALAKLLKNQKQQAKINNFSNNILLNVHVCYSPFNNCHVLEGFDWLQIKAYNVFPEANTSKDNPYQKSCKGPN